MKQFFSKYTNGFLAIALLVYYVLFSWVLHRTGFEHSEALFVAQKIKTVFESTESTLLILGTTFPSFIFLSSLVFTPFGYIFAPVLASISFSVILFYVLLTDFKETSKFKPYVYVPLLLLLFVAHPGFLYGAITGRGVAAVSLFFYLTFRSIFRYYKTQTTFYLSMASLYLTCLVFCNFTFIWMVFGFFPFIVLISLEGLKINKDVPPVVQYFESLNNRSQRRKLTNRAIAIFIILFLLPLGALVLFRYLNATHAGDPTYFLTSQYANWHVLGDTSLGEIVNNQTGGNVKFQSQLVFQIFLFFVNPLLVLMFFYYKGKLYELFTLLAPFLYISLIIIHTQYYFTIEYYLIFTVIALTGLSFYAQRSVKKIYTFALFFGFGVLTVLGGIYYFKNSNDKFEKLFVKTITDVKLWFQPKAVTEEMQIATYLSSIIDPNNKVLIDDAAAFEIIAHMRTLQGIVLPSDKTFVTIVENPILGSRFICVAKENNKYRTFTVLNSFNLSQMVARAQFTAEMMFETKHWAIYKMYSN